MNRAVFDGLSLADRAGWAACEGRQRTERSAKGQFFTPTVAARLLASWFSETGLNRSSIRILDPGAGGGVLTAALVERIVQLRRDGKLPELGQVSMEAWEVEDDFLPILDETLETCVEGLRGVGVRADFSLERGNFVEGMVQRLSGDLFCDAACHDFSHTILNPPYRKLSRASDDWKRLESIGIEACNLYSAFVWLGARTLSSEGEMSAITPRSFCNGPYFRHFRGELLARTNVTNVHLIDSRTEAFGRDDVLQENVLFHARRASKPVRELEISSGSLVTANTMRIPQEQFVSPRDPEKVMHLAVGADARETREFFESLTNSLDDLGVEVSTGPVVDFRMRAFLSHELADDSVPLIYPYCVNHGKVVPPPANSADHVSGRLSRKPVAIHNHDESRRWLLPKDRFVLVKRFSSKEERRRIVSGVLEPSEFDGEFLGLENHLNFFHVNRCGLPQAFAWGLSRFLNSTVADRYFRQFNGHTQVNASDIRAIRFPSIEDLVSVGEQPVDDSRQESIDSVIERCLGAPVLRTG